MDDILASIEDAFIKLIDVLKDEANLSIGKQVTVYESKMFSNTIIFAEYHFYTDKDGLYNLKARVGLRRNDGRYTTLTGVDATNEEIDEIVNDVIRYMKMAWQRDRVNWGTTV